MITEIMYKYAAELDKKDVAVAALPAAGAVGGLAYNKVKQHNIAKQQADLKSQAKQLRNLRNKVYGSATDALQTRDRHNIKVLNHIDDTVGATASEFKDANKVLSRARRAANADFLANRKALPKHLGVGAALAALPAAAYLAHRKLSKD